MHRTRRDFNPLQPNYQLDVLSKGTSSFNNISQEANILVQLLKLRKTRKNINLKVNTSFKSNTLTGHIETEDRKPVLTKKLLLKLHSLSQQELYQVEKPLLMGFPPLKKLQPLIGS